MLAVAKCFGIFVIAFHLKFDWRSFAGKNLYLNTYVGHRDVLFILVCDIVAYRKQTFVSTLYEK